MKKLLYVLPVLMLIGSLACAQGLTGKGFKVGLNLATWGGSDADDLGGAEDLVPGMSIDKKIRLGFSVGGFLTFSISETFSIQPELIYTMKGVKYEMSGSFEEMGVTITYDGEDIFKLAYLEVPLLAKISFSSGSSIRPNLQIGPAMAILLSAKDDWELSVTGEEQGVSMTISESDEEDVKDDFKDIDFGLVFGGGLDFDVGTGTVTVDARYSLGLLNIPDVEGDEDEPSIKNNVISVMLGYSF